MLIYSVARDGSFEVFKMLKGKKIKKVNYDKKNKIDKKIKKVYNVNVVIIVEEDAKNDLSDHKSNFRKIETVDR